MDTVWDTWEEEHVEAKTVLRFCGLFVPRSCIAMAHVLLTLFIRSDLGSSQRSGKNVGIQVKSGASNR